MTIFEHPLWPTLLRHLYIAQGELGINGPRHRIEVARSCPRSVLDMRVACAACGAWMHPVRETKRGVWTFNVSCPLDVNVNCARLKPSTALASQVRDVMAHRTPRRQLELF